ncbi:glycerol kinase GlpK [Cyclobacteriaceae bacterium YHN15]|nr:glycerol kinase GlpK [Cyclobacteriaceae bacterium YHN15]
MSKERRFILAIDQGTSGTKTIIFDQDANLVCKASAPLASLFLDHGFVEQDPEQIYFNVLSSVQKCMLKFLESGYSKKDIACIGISNQRETFVLWNEESKALHNAVSWQCKRSLEICERLKNDKKLETDIKQKTGLIIDPYFSGSKLIWLKENQEGIRKAISDGKAYFGTIDTWLLYKLSHGVSYFTDYTNASRTMFFNLHDLSWDRKLLEQFDLSNLRLPEPKPSSYNFGKTDFDGLFDKPIPITAIIGDSHAAAFGEGCFTPGSAKATLGTGCSILMNIGPKYKSSDHGMVTTVCWSTEERLDFAMEGIIVSCGATIEWIKKELGLFSQSQDTEEMALSVQDNGGVYLIPAFSGLGAPHWQMARKASISGLNFSSTKNHIVRAALESIPYQIKDIVKTMALDSGIELEELMVDGGISSNRFVLDFLASLLDKPVKTLVMHDVSALGAALMAGLKQGVFKDLEELQKLNGANEVIRPSMGKAEIQKYYYDWTKTLEGVL